MNKIKKVQQLPKSLLIEQEITKQQKSFKLELNSEPNFNSLMFPSSLRSPGVPISAHTKELVIITKRKTTQEDKHKQRG